MMPESCEEPECDNMLSSDEEIARGTCDECEDLEDCCREARLTGESHYHCGNCGGVTGMFGHYSFNYEKNEGHFTCQS